MKIENPLLAQVSTGGVQPASAPQTGNPAGKTSLDSLLDEVQLSNLGAALRELSAKEAAKEAAPAGRLQAISSEVADGRYQVDPLVLSQRIIQDTVSIF